jgi:DNA-binding HxlR family transcriptional regulator
MSASSAWTTHRSLGNGDLTADFDAECLATREILNRVGDKWSVLLVVILGHGERRFNELKRAGSSAMGS